MKRAFKLFAFILLAMLFAGRVYAGTTNLDDLVLSGDLTVGDDLTITDDMTADAITATGLVTFKTNLIAEGRVGASTWVASSSTNLAPADLPYTLILKRVGGVGGKDETNGGTRLQNGKPGQVITFLITALQGSGTYVITPNTCTGFTSITMDTKGDLLTLAYVNDTIGWIVTAAAGVTINQPGAYPIG